MPQYKYKAQNSEGKQVKGVLSAADETELQQKLREKNLYFLSAKEQKGGVSSSQFKPAVLAEFSRQVGTLMGAGVSLVKALNIIASAENIKPKEKAVYEELLRQIRKGVALSDAMEEVGGAFPPLMVYMYRSAESGGNLDDVAMKVAVMYEKEHRLNGKISSSLVYPKILGGMIVAVVMIMTNFVLPQLQSLLDMMDQLPTSTAILMGFSDFMTNYWFLVIGGGVGIWVGTKALLAVPKVRLQWHKFVLKVPVFGKLQKVVCTSRFARTLSYLYASGIPIISAVQIARKTAGNDFIDAQFDEVIPFIRAGNNLSDGLRKVNGLIRKLSDSIVVGEETGALDSMLVSTSDALEYDADVAITKMVSYIEPCMLILMGIVVGFVILAVFNALYGSYDSISAI